MAQAQSWCPQKAACVRHRPGSDDGNCNCRDCKWSRESHRAGKVGMQCAPWDVTCTERRNARKNPPYAAWSCMRRVHLIQV